MNLNTFNEKILNFAKENPNWIFDILMNPVENYATIYVKPKDNKDYTICCVNFSYTMIALEKPVENCNQLAIDLEYEYTNVCAKTTLEECKFIDKIKETFKEN